MEIKTPDLGVDNAEVSEIFVKVGDTIAVNDNILLVESDKAAVEIPSTHAGTVQEILVNVGDKITHGDDLIILQAQTNEVKTANITEDTITEPKKPTQNPSTTQQYTLPDLGVDTAQISELMVTIGDSVQKDQPLILVESDKASVEVPAPVTGKITDILVKVGESVKNGQIFIEIQSDNPSTNHEAIATPNTQTVTPTNPPKQPTVHQPNPQTSTIHQSTTQIYAGPAVRKLTRQLGVDIRQVTGSGVRGRIVKEDVFAFVKNKLSNPTQNQPIITQTNTLPNLPDMSKVEIWGEIEYQDLSRLQKVSIPQLNYNTHLPQVTQFDLSDITETENLRQSLKDELKKQGINLTLLAFIMKAVAYALMQFPKFNSHLTDDNQKIVLRKTVNMGFAVATDDGLTVPVIQNVQTKGIKQLAHEIGELAKKARDKKLGTKELTGASFTISSQGNLGGTYFTPLVNWPQVAILGISESSMQPRWNADTQTFEPRLMLPLSLSYDHRVINGADAAVFTRYIAQLLTDPRKILL